LEPRGASRSIVFFLLAGTNARRGDEVAYFLLTSRTNTRGFS
jgi:hypothetical protein